MTPDGRGRDDEKSFGPMQSRFSAPSIVSRGGGNRMSYGAMAFLSNPLSHVGSRFPQLGSMTHAIRNSFMPSPPAMADLITGTTSRPSSHGWGNNKFIVTNPDPRSTFSSSRQSSFGPNIGASMLVPAPTASNGPASSASRHSDLSAYTMPKSILRQSAYDNQQNQYPDFNQPYVPPNREVLQDNIRSGPIIDHDHNRMITRSPSPMFDFTAPPVRPESQDSISGMITFSHQPNSSTYETAGNYSDIRSIAPAGFPLPPERHHSSRNLLPPVMPTTPMFGNASDARPSMVGSSIFEYSQYADAIDENGIIRSRESLATTRTALSTDDRKTGNWYDKPLRDGDGPRESSTSVIGAEYSIYGGVERQQGGLHGRAKSVKSVRWDTEDVQEEMGGVEPLPGRLGGRAV